MKILIERARAYLFERQCLPHRAPSPIEAVASIVVDGRIVGFWEYDPDETAVVWKCFDRPASAIEQQIRERAHSLSSFIADQLGHGKSFSLSTDDDLRRRVGEVRALKP